MDARLFHANLFGAASPLIPKGSAVVCGVSGGPDSVALLHGLAKVSEIQQQAWALHVAHFDHKLRPESAVESQFVRSLAAEMRLPCTVAEADVAAEAVNQRQTREEAARRLRYAFLIDVAKKANSRIVAVAHHADDQAETVLHRILRGTGLRGLSGIPIKRPILDREPIDLIRPLLGFQRRDILAYLEECGLKFCEDPTNADPSAATRNAIRHEILPMLEGRLNPQVATALGRLATQAARAEEAITVFASQRMSDVVLEDTPELVSLSAPALARLPRAVQDEIIVLVLAKLNVPMKKIGFERIEAATELAQGEGHKRSIQLAGGVTVTRKGRQMIFSRPASKPQAPAEDISQRSVH